MLLSCIGGTAGLVIARWGDAVLLQLVGENLDVHPQARVFIFTLTVSTLVGLLFGIVPAFQAIHLDLNTALKGTVGGAVKASRASFGRMLVVAQVALSLLLLIVAGLFVHSFQKLAAVDLGYDHDHLLLFEVSPLTAGYKGAAIGQLAQKLVERIRVIPGVRSASFSLFARSFSAGQGVDQGIFRSRVMHRPPARR